MKISLVSAAFAASSLLVAPALAAGAIVHVEAKTPVRLERQVQGRWETACEAPCDRPLDDSAEVRFVDETGPRAPFRIRTGGEATITLHHEPRTATGPALVAVGGCVTAIGVAGLGATIVTANQQAGREADPVWSRSHDPGASGLASLVYGVVSVVVILGGGAMLVAGIATNAYDDGVGQRRATSRPPKRQLLAAPLGFTF